jgi:hypothetical protein
MWVDFSRVSRSTDFAPLDEYADHNSNPDFNCLCGGREKYGNTGYLSVQYILGSLSKI